MQSIHRTKCELYNLTVIHKNNTIHAQLIFIPSQQKVGFMIENAIQKYWIHYNEPFEPVNILLPLALKELPKVLFYDHNWQRQRTTSPTKENLS
jgi:hypothetical protein